MSVVRCPTCSLPLTREEADRSCCPGCQHPLEKRDAPVGENGPPDDAYSAKVGAGQCDLCDGHSDSRLVVCLRIWTVDQQGSLMVRRWLNIRTICCPACWRNARRFRRRYWLVWLILLLFFPACYGGVLLMAWLNASVWSLPLIILVAACLIYFLAETYYTFLLRRFVNGLTPGAAAVVQLVGRQFGRLSRKLQIRRHVPSDERFFSFADARRKLTR
jgi:hypothetical protein